MELWAFVIFMVSILLGKQHVGVS